MSPKLGDFGLVSTRGFVGRMIRLITRSRVNHAFVYVGDGQIVEGEPHGALLSPVGKYRTVTWSDVPLTADQRLEVATWARAHVGTPYSWLDDLEIGLVDVFGWAPKFMRRRLRSDRTLMCSQLVDAAYSAAGVELFADGRPAGGVSPGDLLKVVEAERESVTTGRPS